ncbi:ABC transporter permease [uncultured Serinicoccus sp.]|uniref:ABC transporter permease n=1 Tax=uncultured Serinicoccus sp. TaxID=735514 RepID=UPI002638E431|nr:ABC transporter permease [uncultured Serinicoccus sp.]
MPIVRRFLQQRLALLATFFILLVTVSAVLAPLLSPYPPEQTDLMAVLQGPNGAHLLGTDDLGRDVVSRLIYGGRTTLLAALQATLLALVGGVPLGMFAGFAGGVADTILSRIADAFMTFPPLLLAVIIVGLTGPGLENAMLAIGVVFAPRLFRVSRAAVIGIMPETYIKAAQTLGASPVRILVRNVLPNALSPLLVQISLTMATAILAEASLSFLGLGVQPPEASWGSILGRSVPFMTSQPAAVLGSGALIFALVLSFNVLGDGLRDSIGRERR